ncbi:MAG: hypothetical protein IE922_09505 [Sphingomonadales bacterium]|nr:hypothetical protein [Sphingomonadales bacterium]
MTLLFRRRGARHRHRIQRGVPRDLPPHLMRDIGLDPWPDRPRLPFHPLW